MMDWLDLTIKYLGIATLTVLVLAAVVGVFLAALFVLMRFTPRLHAGRPTNYGELCFYDQRSIVTGKNGESLPWSPRMINAPLSIRWWFGLSYRPAPKWFIGVIRWDPKVDR